MPSDPDAAKTNAELTFQEESQRASAVDFDDIQFRTTRNSVVEGDVVDFGTMARDVLLNIDTAANSSVK